MATYSVEIRVGINTATHIAHTWLYLTRPDGPPTTSGSVAASCATACGNVVFVDEQSPIWHNNAC